MTRLERIATHYGIATNLFVSLNIQDKLISVEKNIVTPNFYERFAPGLLQLPGLDMYEMFNIEEVKDLNPNAFIVPARMNGNIQSLKEAGIPTIIINPEGMESIKNTILYLGNIMGVQERAQLLVEYLTVKIEFLKHLCAGIKRRPPVYFCSHLDIYRACSRMMIQNELIEMGGGM